LFPAGLLGEMPRFVVRVEEEERGGGEGRKTLQIRV